MKKIFLILFVMVSAGINAQVFDYQPMRTLPYGFINAEQTIRAAEKERMALIQNKVKVITITDTLHNAVKKLFFDKNGRCTEMFRYGINEEHVIFMYDNNGNLVRMETTGPADYKSTGIIKYEGMKLVSSELKSNSGYIYFNSKATYHADRLRSVIIKLPGTNADAELTVQNGTDTLALVLTPPSEEEVKILEEKEKKVNKKSDSRYESSTATDTISIGEENPDETKADDENINEDITKSGRTDENYRHVMYQIFIKPDTIISREGFMLSEKKTIYKNDMIVKTENDNEDFGVITTNYFYKPNGLIDYSVSSQKRGNSDGRRNFIYEYYEE
jgi:hypothetical protein